MRISSTNLQEIVKPACTNPFQFIFNGVEWDPYGENYSTNHPRSWITRDSNRIPQGIHPSKPDISRITTPIRRISANHSVPSRVAWAAQDKKCNQKNPGSILSKLTQWRWIDRATVQNKTENFR